MKVKSYEELVVWQKAMLLAKNVYCLEPWLLADCRRCLHAR